jgi:FkbM family methyltransferase
MLLLLYWCFPEPPKVTLRLLMNTPIQTLLQLLNHSLRMHPELASPIESICHEIQGKKSEFKLNISKWFADNGDKTLRLNYPLHSNSVVFDLGGYMGDFAAEIHEKYKCHVYVFEPSSRYYEKCVQRFIENPKIKCFNYGLSNEEGSFTLSQQGDGSRIFMQDSNGASEQVSVKNASSVIRSFGIAEINLIKINIEGGEFGVLSSLISSGLISSIDHVQVQFHEFVPNSWKLRDQLRIELTKTHNELWNYPFVWESWARK